MSLTDLSKTYEKLMHDKNKKRNIRHPVGLKKAINYLMSMRFHAEYKILQISNTKDFF